MPQPSGEGRERWALAVAPSLLGTRARRHAGVSEGVASGTHLGTVPAVPRRAPRGDRASAVRWGSRAHAGLCQDADHTDSECNAAPQHLASSPVPVP